MTSPPMLPLQSLKLVSIFILLNLTSLILISFFYFPCWLFLEFYLYLIFNTPICLSKVNTYLDLLSYSSILFIITSNKMLWVVGICCGMDPRQSGQRPVQSGWAWLGTVGMVAKGPLLLQDPLPSCSSVTFNSLFRKDLRLVSSLVLFMPREICDVLYLGLIVQLGIKSYIAIYFPWEFLWYLIIFSHTVLLISSWVSNYLSLHCW